MSTKMSRYQVVDLARIDALEAELKQLTIIRNNMPREAWGHIEQKMADVRAQIREVEEQAHQNMQNAKVAMIKAILVCDLITDVAEDFADASRKMLYSGTAGDTFRQMVKACSDRHEICMREWGEVVKCIDSKGDIVGEEYSEWYDKFRDEIQPVIDDFVEQMRNSKFWRKI